MTTSARIRFVNIALEQLGKPVLMGARGPDAFDCSGHFTWALEQVGGKAMRQTHNAQMLHDQSPAITLDHVLAGDALFFGHDAAHVSHIAIALKGGMALSADGATHAIKELAVALKNPKNSVRLHDHFTFRPDQPYFAVHRNVWVDAVDGVCR